MWKKIPIEGKTAGPVCRELGSRGHVHAVESGVKTDERRTARGADVSPHCYEFCQAARRRFWFSFLFIKSFFFWSLFFPSGCGCLKRLPGIGQQIKPLLFLLSVLGPAGTAQVDSCGHSQETGAPNLQIGPLPAPVRLRARAVSKSPQSVRDNQFAVVSLSEGLPAMRQPSASPFVPR